MADCVSAFSAYGAKKKTAAKKKPVTKKVGVAATKKTTANKTAIAGAKKKAATAATKKTAAKKTATATAIKKTAGAGTSKANGKKSANSTKTGPKANSGPKATTKKPTSAAAGASSKNKPAMQMKCSGGVCTLVKVKSTAKAGGKTGVNKAPKPKRKNVKDSGFDDDIRKYLAVSSSQLNTPGRKKRAALESYLLNGMANDETVSNEAYSPDMTAMVPYGHSEDFSDDLEEEEEEDDLEYDSEFETDSYDDEEYDEDDETHDINSNTVVEIKPSAPKRYSMPDTDYDNGGDAAQLKKAKTSEALYFARNAPQKRRSLATSTLIEKSVGADYGPNNNGINIEKLLRESSVASTNSIAKGEKTFQWLLSPVTLKEFYRTFWESKSCYVKRNQTNYYSHLISFEKMDQMFLNNHVEFTTNVDITSYKNGVRETWNPQGRAIPSLVWEEFAEGNSIRLLNPQLFIQEINTLCTTLQEYFHCFVGANVYLTPNNTQGFAPHYDDIEAFVLQIEGRKRWKLYSPLSPNDQLPRTSSGNFNESEIGKPIFEKVLMPGDLLYFPRGTIHQAHSEPGFHSLHITLSVYQKQSYADLFEQILPNILQRAIASNVELRRGLPLYTWRNAGIAFADVDTKERDKLKKKVSSLLMNYVKEIPIGDVIDEAVDQLAKKFQIQALPPKIEPAERPHTVFGARNFMNKRGDCECNYDIDLHTNMRLLRANILRLVVENNKNCLYHYVDNMSLTSEPNPQCFQIESDEASCIELLMKSYPKFISVSELPIICDERKMNFATGLWERGLLMTEQPMV